MALQLPLVKSGETAQKLSLNLSKAAKFSVELYWDSEHDLDGHGLLANNSGNGAKISDFASILSTYVMKRMVNGKEEGMFAANADGSFSTPCGGLTHSGDSRTGVGKAVDEIITIDGAKIPSSVNEIPIFVTIHPSKSAKFADVRSAGIRIKNDQGTVLGEYELTNQFKEFDAVQMGSLLLGNNGWSYSAAGAGFNGDFNTILGHFS